MEIKTVFLLLVCLSLYFEACNGCGCYGRKRFNADSRILNTLNTMPTIQPDIAPGFYPQPTMKFLPLTKASEAFPSMQSMQTFQPNFQQIANSGACSSCGNFCGGSCGLNVNGL